MPKGEFIDRQQERFIDEGAQEGSSRKKKIRDSDRDALRVHVGELDTSFGHEFFANQSTLALASGSGGSTAEQEEQDKRGNVVVIIMSRAAVRMTATIALVVRVNT